MYIKNFNNILAIRFHLWYNIIYEILGANENRGFGGMVGSALALMIHDRIIAKRKENSG